MAIELRHIRQILALDKHRNFGRAAKELNLTQPALSRNIRVLEEQLGVALFSRSRPQIAPTLFGQHIINRGTSLLLDSQKMELEIAQLAGLERGTIKVGAGPLPADMYIGPVFAKMNRLYPKHHLHLEVNWPQVLAEQLRAQLLDAIVVDIRLIEDTSDLNITMLPEELGFWICRAAHPLTRTKPLNYQQMLKYPVAVFQFPESVQRVFAHRANLSLEQWNEAPNGKIECYNTSVLLQTILGSDAVGVTAGRTYQKELTAGDIIRLPIDTPEIKSQFAVATLKKYLKPPIVHLFTKYLLETTSGA